MIFGIGIDTIEIDRIEKSISRPWFTAASFSEEELEELSKKKAQSAAACFAAKEAFFKALGTGMYPGQLTQVSLLHEENGKPYLTFSGEAKETTEKLGLKCHISITHDGGFSTAIVVLEKL